jgi:RimJ/RimL family protein N-acetyltransferase
MIVTSDEILKGDSVHFTRLQLQNIYTHFDWNNDPELNNLDSEIPYVEEGFGDFKRRFERLVYDPRPNGLDYEVHANDGTLIGVAYVTDISEYNAHGTIGITIGNRDYWGKGYGRDALAVLLDHCFEDLGMHRVSAETFEFNDAWRRLVQWAGFEREGVVADFVRRGDEFFDKEIYGLVEGAYRYRRLHAMAGLQGATRRPTAGRLRMG